MPLSDTESRQRLASKLLHSLLRTDTSQNNIGRDRKAENPTIMIGTKLGEQPNDRMISKLCEYASKNPLRIPKITSSLEQRLYRDLRSEQFHSVQVIVCVYRKLMISCKEQIQRDGTYMFNLDGLIPKLCLLAQEMGEDRRVQRLRSAGLQTLSSVVWFMGEFSHVSAEFDNVVSVVLENYRGLETSDADKQDTQNGCVKDGFSSADAMTSVSWRSIVSENGEVHVSVEEAENPKFWSRVCLHNMAKLAKEVTTVRRVLESLFRFFDNEELWSTQNGVALSVLQDMQLIIEKCGENTHFLLSILVKHLDHKNVLKKPSMQLHIVHVATSLARQTKVQPSVAIIGALTDMTRHLRKSIHSSLDDSNLGAEVIQYNQNFRAVVDECLVQLSHKVGDAGPVLDMMAVMLENMPNITLMARTLISAVYQDCVVSILVPYIILIPSKHEMLQAFPEALFHSLLLAMVYADHETRVGAHCIFSVVLVPSSVCPCPPAATSFPNKATKLQKTLSRTVSVFSSSAALFKKLGREDKENAVDDKVGNINGISMQDRLNCAGAENAKIQNHSILNRLKSSYSRAYSVKYLNPPATIEDEKSMSNAVEVTALPLRLSSHQITLMLSSIWAQSISPLNTPENFEAIAHTYSLVLLFARTKNSCNEAMIRSFQLAFTLRSISLGGGGPLQPSRRRSLFILATSMIIFSSKAYNIPPLFPCVKASLTAKTVDPFLELVDDCKLQTAKTEPEHPGKVYGSKEDNEDALKSLSGIEIAENQSKESLATMIVKFLGNLSHVEPPLFTVDDDDVLPSKFESKTGPDAHLAPELQNFLSVDDLLDALSETTNQVGRSSVSSPPDMPYSEMAGHCEALLMGKQQKMSTVMSAQQNQESSVSNYAKEVQPHSLVESNYVKSENPFIDQNMGAVSLNQYAGTALMLCATEYHQQPYFQLPVSSPYDHFLKAAGC
ncbi:hypothetical protein QQP08_002252 [Theobroma cacao]|nr:hypothetical protein QQP08_002252 [Theobroma cacao]